jgi:hypothetical protein
MNKTQKNTFLIFVVLAVSLSVFGFAYANPSYFATTVTTNSAASTSPAYLTPGVSTSTTPVYDAYAQTVAGGGTYKADSAGLVIQFTASSTASVLNASVEYSADCIDYYRNFVLDSRQLGTSTAPYSLDTAFSARWKFASSSLNGTAVSASNNLSTAALVVPTPFRCTRVVFSVTGGNGAVWAQLVPVKELK